MVEQSTPNALVEVRFLVPGPAQYSSTPRPQPQN